MSQIVDAFDVEVDEFLTNKMQSQSLDDELLNSSINDIYESIEDDPTIDYQSLVTEDELIHDEIEPQLIVEARNVMMEDCLTETTQEILQEQRFDFVSSFVVNAPESSSNISNENYICKVQPSEFDLSVDSVMKPKSDILDVIVAEGVEDNSVPQAVYISSKPALIAVEIATHEKSPNEEKSEQTPSIPKLIISKICGDTPPPIVVDADDYVSLKPKKILKAQDSLELPADDRDKFEPTKRVDSFELKDVPRNVDAKFNAPEKIVNPVVVNTDPDKDSEEDFVIITEEEAKALEIEEQQTQIKSQEQVVSVEATIDDSLASNVSENPLTIATSDESEDTNLSLNENDKMQDSRSVTTVKPVSTNQAFEVYDRNASASEISSQLELNHSTVTVARKTFELSTIPESLTLPNTTSAPYNTYTTSNLFTSNQSIVFDPPTTNTSQLDEHGPLPGAY